MLRQKAAYLAFVVTLGATEWVINIEKYFMLGQKASYFDFVVTLGAAERVINSKKYFMLLQKATSIRVASQKFILSIFSHTGSSCMGYHR